MSCLPGLTSPTLDAGTLTFLQAHRAAAPVVRDAPRRQGAGRRAGAHVRAYIRVRSGLRGVPLGGSWEPGGAGWGERGGRAPRFWGARLGINGLFWGRVRSRAWGRARTGVLVLLGTF